MDKICSCFGHAKIDITDKLRKQVYKVYEDLINREFNVFYFGGFGDFDDLCWRVVSELQTKYPHIKRVYCVENEKYLRPNKRPKYLKDEDYEEFIYLMPTFNWWYTQIYYRNREMVNESDFIVFYVNDAEKSRSYKFLQYAIQQHKPYTNIAFEVY